MRKYLLLLLVLVSLKNNAQQLVSATYLKSYPASYFAQQFGLFAGYDVDLYRIIYTSKEVNGDATNVSGLVCLPKVKTSGYPMLVYQHGTAGSRIEVPGYESFESVLPSIFSSIGFISIAPDYLGLGVDQGVHPYVHAASESWVGEHMLAAVQQFLDEEGYNTTKDLFLCGYSQGGHASMALHRSLEANNRGFTLKAASHMSGPYSISSGMKDLLISEEAYSTVAYLPLVALSYNEVYGIFPQNNLRNFFKGEYADLIEQFANGDYDLWVLNTKLIARLEMQYGKAIPKNMLLPEVLNAIVSDNNHPVNVALRDNDVYDWKPTIPTRLLYCKADEQVTYVNSIIAETKMKQNGSISVAAFDVNTNGSHSSCVSPAITSTLFFFLGLQQISATQQLTEALNIYPNPASSMVYVKGNTAVGVSLLDAKGTVFTPTLEANSLDVQGIPAGYYIVLMNFEDGSNARTSLIIK